MSAPDPVRRIRFATTDIDEGMEALGAQYAEVRAEFARDGEDFAFRLASDVVDAHSGPWSLEQVYLGLRATASVEPLNAVMFAVPLTGRALFRCGRDEVDSGVVLAPTRSGYDVGWSDLGGVTGTLDLEGVQRVGAELSGLAPHAVGFTGMRPVSPALGRHLAAVASTVKRTLLDQAGALQSALTRDHAFRVLAGAVLATFPNTTHDRDGRGGGDAVEPACLRRALAFIDENADRPIGLTDIAAAAGTSSRGLQRAFARHRDTTPLRHLREVRLERAHHELRRADPATGATVSAIAARWGFPHPGRFAADHHRRFGEAPATTLRR
ncbi:AraC family transcriptional regulator [Actinomycetospora lemnae]|uniref:Helix-turn-helix domain-containing protein n=1 Tax=Actinomycetospora lemnae TaxID=3019891 RepID=A0ABT5SYR3_9PSEU|nr:helix-turn-helix domain-containing protein [Actinomycetospora sp. DW7H6]MDD7968005.1 helix-turn-helix domain-containing protein [Actinomycetospora sp. DW7H6]